MLRIRNGVYTHPETGDVAKKRREGRRERRSISRTECNERDVSERESKRGVYRRRGHSRESAKGDLGKARFSWRGEGEDRG